jgi:hypothetical protein
LIDESEKTAKTNCSSKHQLTHRRSNATYFDVAVAVVEGGSGVALDFSSRSALLNSTTGVDEVVVKEVPVSVGAVDNSVVSVKLRDVVVPVGFDEGSNGSNSELSNPPPPPAVNDDVNPLWLESESDIIMPVVLEPVLAAANFPVLVSVGAVSVGEIPSSGPIFKRGVSEELPGLGVDGGCVAAL